MPTDEPNVLWICTDQQRFDTLGCYGNEFVETPNVDRLAASGTRFERAFCQNPVCTPSRASFLTGRYPRTTGARGNGINTPADETLVTKRLADEGYTCGLAGKLHLSPCQPVESTDHPSRERRIDDGYAEFHWSQNNGPDWPTNEYLHWLRDEGVNFEQHVFLDEASNTQRIDRSDEFPDRPYADCEHVQISMPEEHHHTTWCARKAINFVEANADEDRPWLFSVNLFDPHHAFDPPAEYLDRYLDQVGLDSIPLPNYEEGELDDKPVFQRMDHEGAYNDPANYPYPDMTSEDHRLVRAAYWAMVDLVDAGVGRMLDALDRTGQRENTIVVFMSDHGELLGDHGIYLKGPHFYDPAVRVPLVLSGPGIRESTVETSLVELTDLTPTLLDAAGFEHHPGIQGESLWPRLSEDRDDGHADGPHRESVYSEYYHSMPWHDDPAPNATMVRTDRHKLVKMHGRRVGELYDLGADPEETHNRWDDPEYAEVKAELLDRMTDRMADTVDPLPPRIADW